MDWKLLIEKLVADGLTQPQIAERAGCAQSTLSGIATGKTKDPRSSIGIALLRLAHERSVEVQLPWVPAGAVVLGRRVYSPDAVAAGVPPDTVGRRRNGPGRRATDRLVVEQVGGAQGAEQGV